MVKKERSRLRDFNNALSVVVLVLGLYITLMPFLPNMQFWVKKTIHAYPQLVEQNLPEKPKDEEVIPSENTLVIPGIGMQELVHESSSAAALSKGVWRRPHTSDPTKDGNTVLVGHRFTYAKPQGVFYHLDKVKNGDTIVLYWQGKKYSYKVERTFVVPSDRVEIEAPTDEPVLTLYTCTPLWNPKDRLVIQAKSAEAQE
ncbi:MAG TPA: class E sortase [Candidatus Saccharimonadales bacterium]